MIIMFGFSIRTVVNIVRSVVAELMRALSLLGLSGFFNF